MRRGNGEVNERKRVAVNHSKRDLPRGSGSGAIRGKSVEGADAPLLRGRKLRRSEGYDMTYDFNDLPASDYELMYQT